MKSKDAETKTIHLTEDEIRKFCKVDESFSLRIANVDREYDGKKLIPSLMVRFEKVK